MAPPALPLNRAKPATDFVVSHQPLSTAQTVATSSLRLSLVIPTFNEVSSLAALVEQLDQQLSLALPQQYEIIVVDDNSPDGTGQLAIELAQQYSAVKLLNRQQERGLATAVVRGWQQAQGQFLAVMDGDLQHPPRVILDLLAALQQGASLAIASRYLDPGQKDEWRGLRRSLSRSAQFLGQLVVPSLFQGLSDPLSGCFAMRREVIAGRSLNPMGYKILLEVLAKGTVQSVAEISYPFSQRHSGHSKVSAQHYWQYLVHLIRLRWSLGFSSKLKPINYDVTQHPH